MIQPGRDDQLHSARGVLGLVVVPALLAGGKHDLAGIGGDRITVADNRALDLKPCCSRLDDCERVVLERERQRRGQLIGLRDASDPNRGAEPSGLHEHRQAELRQLREHACGIGCKARLIDRAVAHLRDPCVCHQVLEHDLVHAQRTRKHTRPDIWHVEALKQALQRPVLPERPVQHREDDVDTVEPGPELQRHGLPILTPAAVTTHLDPADLMPGCGQTVGDRRRRGE